MAKNKKMGTRKRSSSASFKPYNAAIHAARAAATAAPKYTYHKPPPPPAAPLSQLTGIATSYHRSNSHKSYVLTATHHIHDTQPRLYRTCASKTTVCGVFTSRELAERAQALECRRLGFDASDTCTVTSGNAIYHYANGSYCTTFQIDEREIWSFPCAEQKVVLDSEAERAQWNTGSGGWMGNTSGGMSTGGWMGGATAAAVAVGSPSNLKKAEDSGGDDDDSDDDNGEEKKEGA